MDKAQNILWKSSKKVCIEAAEKALESEEFMNALLKLSLSDKKPYSHRASWALVYLAQEDSNKVRPYLKEIAKALDHIENHIQIGSFLRIFDQMIFDLDEFGDLLDHCLHTLRMPLKAEYLRVIALNIILKFGKTYPELIPELIEEIELSQKHFEMNHCKRKAKSVLKELKNFERRI